MNSNERERALLALLGRRVPAVGELGFHEFPSRGGVTKLQVRVERVSATGKTVWLRFTGSKKDRFGKYVNPPDVTKVHRWVRGKWGTNWYPYSTRQESGVVWFPKDEGQ